MMKTKIKILLGISLSVCLCTGCSRTDWAVKWADTYLSWKIIDQFELSGTAKDQTKAEATQLVQNFRKNKFPWLAQHFEKGAEEFSNLDFTSEAQITAWVGKQFDESERFLDSLAAEVEPSASKVAALVEKKNWQAFLRNFEEENQKILKKKTNCSDRFEDNLEDWLGDLKESQEVTIERYCQDRPKTQELRVQNRKHQIGLFRSWVEIEGEFNKSLFESSVPRWLKSYRSFQNEESKSYWVKTKEDLKKTFTQILKDSSESQRKKFIAQLRDRAQNFSKLSL